MLKKLFFVSMIAFGLMTFAQVDDDGTAHVPVAPGFSAGDSFDALGSLTTLFAQNNGYAGNMFDVEVTTPLSIVGMDINVENQATSSVWVYYRQGTCVGNEQNPALWTLYGQDTAVTPNGPNVPTPVNITGPTLDPGQVYGFFVYVDYPTLRINYTNGPATVYSNADMSITTHCGNASPMFTGSVFQDRMWNGTIYYDTALSIPTLSQWGLIVFAALLLTAGLVFMRRRAAARA